MSGTSGDSSSAESDAPLSGVLTHVPRRKFLFVAGIGASLAVIFGVSVISYRNHHTIVCSAKWHAGIPTAPPPQFKRRMADRSKYNYVGKPPTGNCVFNYTERCQDICDYYDIRKDIQFQHHINFTSICTSGSCEWQKAQFQTLELVSAFLSEHGIPWSMRAGGLLAAFLYNGCLIPWDDDVDIAVTRKGMSELTAIWESCPESNRTWGSYTCEWRGFPPQKICSRIWEQHEIVINNELWLFSRSKFDMGKMSENQYFLKLRRMSLSDREDMGGIDIEPFEFMDLDVPEDLELVEIGGQACVPVPNAKFAKEYLDRKFGTGWTRVPKDMSTLCS